MPAPVASGWSDFAGWALHPLESAALSRRTPIPDLTQAQSVGRRGVDKSHSQFVSRVDAFRRNRTFTHRRRGSRQGGGGGHVVSPVARRRPDDLFGKTLVGDIEDLLHNLNRIRTAVFQLLENGRQQWIANDDRTYTDPFIADTRNTLSRLEAP